MPQLSRDTAGKVAFVVSAALLAFLYGYLARGFGWFPDAFLDRAVRQGMRRFAPPGGPPDFTSPRVRRTEGSGTAGSAGAEDLAPALTLIISTWRDSASSWKPGLRLIDREGRVLHEWTVSPTELFSRSDYRRGTRLSEQDIHGTHVFADGDVLVNVEYAGTVRLDACGEVRWRVSAGSHHTIARADDGSFWIPGVTDARAARSESFPDGFPGLRGRIHHDLILRVSEEGEVFDVLNVLDLLYANDLQRYIPKNRQHDKSDVVHLNDVEPLPASLAEEYPLFEAGDLLVSLRNLDLVFVVDPESRRVEWHASRPFIMQHDPDFLGKGWIGVFDNNWDGTERGTMLGGSRIVALRPHTGSARVLFPTSESEPFYTAHRGKWQQLDGGRMLLTESDAGRVVEVDAEGRTLWEWTAEPYSESRVPNVSRGARVEVTPEEVAAWPCSPGSSGEPNRSR